MYKYKHTYKADVPTTDEFGDEGLCRRTAFTFKLPANLPAIHIYTHTHAQAFISFC